MCSSIQQLLQQPDTGVDDAVSAAFRWRQAEAGGVKHQPEGIRSVTAAINLGIVGRIFLSWIITIPAGAILAIIFFYILRAVLG